MLISHNRPDSTRKKRPSTPFLITLNALLFLGMMALGANIFGQVIAVILTIAYVAVCGIWHGLIVLTERRYRFHPALRSLLFLIPLLLLLILPLLGVVSPPAQNQVTPLLSPSERYELQVRSHRYWDFLFRDLERSQTEVVETDFAGHYNIYWRWDEEDRLWVFNSENWEVYFWEDTDASWERHHYDADEHPDLAPPEALFPDYYSR